MTIETIEAKQKERERLKKQIVLKMEVKRK